MPLLEREPELSPADLFAGESVPRTDGRFWWVLHTRTRQEKVVARYLYARQLRFYLPLLERRLRVRGQPRDSYMPLFPGYVFLLVTPEERLAALPPRRLVATLRVPDQAKLWYDLRQVYHLLQTGAPITPEDKLGPGDRVEVRNGPLAGMKGTLRRLLSGNRFVIEVNFLQQGASVLIDGFDVGPAP